MVAAAEDIIEMALTHTPTPVRLTNAYCLAVADQNPMYLDLLQGVGRNYPDGAPVAMLMRIAQGGSSSQRVRGPSLFNTVIERGQMRGVRHFMVGSTQTTLNLLTQKLEQEYPAADIVGTYAPPFAPLDDEFYDDVESAIVGHPDLLWIGLGTPKQDFAAVELASRLNIPCVGVGAAFDFVAGTVAEAPPFIQKSGFEWLYRFAREPRRLWRRYTIGNIRFAKSVVQHSSVGRRIWKR
ncbi:hypothetical protein CH268_09345 [Rhodococcus sp. 06-1460-1B]|nr:hypothetical protein CH268_09345 [Rhodococcus sp. 06-1460-1B]